MFRPTSFPRLRSSLPRAGLPSLRWIPASQLHTSLVPPRNSSSSQPQPRRTLRLHERKVEDPFASTRFQKPGHKTPKGRNRGFGAPSPPARTPRPRPDRTPSSEEIVRILSATLKPFLTSQRLASRLKLYGINQEKIEWILEAWGASTTAELQGLEQISKRFPGMGRRDDGEAAKRMREVADAASATGWDFGALGMGLRHDEEWVVGVERTLLRRLLIWIVDTHSLSLENRPEGFPDLHQNLVDRIRSLLAVTDLESVSRDYTSAREMHRHFHLHIGPTNSGKTYNALKSLAIAKTGTYAGPLRLLAHEVWERMNRGTVGGLVAGEGRECNLITGEERRIVSADAGVTACTVEMMSLAAAQEVVVIDEIQMLGDSQRGGAWTTAVMGAQADEVHLCGEETVVGVVEKMVAAMGDKLTIHRYERLTPLKVSEESLDGDLSRVQPGDCVVSFSRSGIFKLKRQIEATTGLRCAVVYGALPPETRSEQAKLFNDDSSGVDVMVASDAVGMGLNLKIRRMIFESMHKWSGQAEVPLSVSQVKQIAGRAGRYGQHSTGSIGEVTTLLPEDLPILNRILPSVPPPVPRATIEAQNEQLAQISLLLGHKVPFAKLLEEFAELAKVPPYCVYRDMKQAIELAELLRDVGEQLSLKEMSVFSQAPVNIRDDKVVQSFLSYMRAYARSGEVDVLECLEATRMVPALEMVEMACKSLQPNLFDPTMDGPQKVAMIPHEVVMAIPHLESFHKALVLYIWLSFRYDLAFHQRVEAEALKLRVEDALEECLERMPGLKTGKRGKSTATRVAIPRKSTALGMLHKGTPAPVAPEDRKPIKWMTRDDYSRWARQEKFGGQVEFGAAKGMTRGE